MAVAIRVKRNFGRLILELVFLECLFGTLPSVDLALEDCRPHYVTQYLFTTADCFTRFYEDCPVLKEPDAGLRMSRLLLCDLSARVLELGLALLGIRTSEQM